MSQTNYRIAEQFVISNIEGHTFPDTNESELRRSITNLKQKLELHNLGHQAERIDYLVSELLKRKFKDTHQAARGETPYSLIRMLLLLQNRPTYYAE